MKICHQHPEAGPEERRQALAAIYRSCASVLRAEKAAGKRSAAGTAGKK